jgi:serine/threonine protein kinase/tetratricopeptide (TPR) repeat protein
MAGSITHLELPERYSPEAIPIGEGAAGHVYRVHDRWLELAVAIKILHIGADSRSDFAASFRAEARAAAKVVHPRVVRLIDSGLLPDGRPYLVSEFVAGGNLSAWLETPPPWPVIQRIVRQLLEGLARMHAAGVLHRDIKPDNVLLTDADPARADAKISDLGLAKLASSSADLEATQRIVGTPMYMAPEQWLPGTSWLGPWTDLYAVGVLLTQLLGIGEPYEGMNVSQVMFAKLSQPAPTFRPLPAFESIVGLETFVQTLVARPPDARYTLAADALAAFDALDQLPREPQDRPTFTPNEDDSVLQGLLDEAPARPYFPVQQMALQPPSPLAAEDLPVAPGLLQFHTIPDFMTPKVQDLVWRAARAVVNAGSPGVLILEGAPGSGQREIARWTATELEAGGWMRCLRVVHDGNGLGFQARLVEAVRRFLNCSGLSKDETRAQIRRYLHRYGETGPEELRLLCRWLAPTRSDGLAETHHGGESADGLDLSTRMALLGRLLARAAHRGGMLLWLDGPHGAAALEGMEIAARILQRARSDGFPLLVVVSVGTLLEESTGALPNPVRDLLGSASCTRLPLEPLAAAPGIAMLRRHCRLTPSLASELWDAVGGDPYLAIDVVTAWAAKGQLVADEDRTWSLCADVGVADLLASSGPSIIDSRVRSAAASPRAARAAEDLLHVLALLGPEASRHAADTALRHLHPGLDAELLTAWKVLTGEGAVEEIGAHTIRFPNRTRFHEVVALVHQRDDVASLHLACARGLLEQERISGLQLAGAAGQHFLAAGRADQAIDHLLRGAQQMRSTHLGAAVEFARAAREALREQGRGGDQMLEAVRLEGDLLQLRGRIDDSEAILARAEDFAGPAVTEVGTAWLLCSRAHNAWLREEFGRAAALLAEAHQHFDGAHDHGGLAFVARLRGDVAMRRGDHPEAAAHYRAAKMQAVVSEGRAEQLDAAWKLARAQRELGRYGTARRGFEAALELARSQGAYRVEGICYRELGNLHMFGDRHQEAEELFRRAADRHKALGADAELAADHNSIGDLMRRRGDHASAEGHYLRALTIARAAGLRSEMGIALLNLALTALAEGDPERAGGHVEEAEDLMASARAHFLRPYLHAIGAQLAAQRRDEAALEIACRGLRETEAPLPVDGELAEILENSARPVLDRHPDLARNLLHLALRIRENLEDVEHVRAIHEMLDSI